MTAPTKNIAESVRELIEANGDISFVHMPANVLTEPLLVSHPQVRVISDLTEKMRSAAQYMRPARRSGTARLATLQSLIDWANRFKGESSALYANPDQSSPSLTCIANYHAAGGADLDGTGFDLTAQHCDHRGTYAFPLSKEWKRWMAVSGKPLDKDEMGQFIEDNAKDFIDPTPALMNPSLPETMPWEDRMIEIAQKINGRFGHHLKLVEMARAFQVYETSNIGVSSNRDTGESTINFISEHKDADGQPIRIPNLFLIAIPVFESGVMYRLPVRFQYRKAGATVKFMLTVYDPARAFDDAFAEAIEIAGKETGLPVFAGTPEA